MLYLINLIQIATFLVYLSDVEEGGETMFPFEVRIRTPVCFPAFVEFSNQLLSLILGLDFRMA